MLILGSRSSDIPTTTIIITIFFKILCKYLKNIVIFAPYLTIKRMCTFNDENVSLAEFDVTIDAALYGNDFDNVSIIEQPEEEPQTDILFE